MACWVQLSYLPRFFFSFLLLIDCICCLFVRGIRKVLLYSNHFPPKRQQFIVLATSGVQATHREVNFYTFAVQAANVIFCNSTCRNDGCNHISGTPENFTCCCIVSVWFGLHFIPLIHDLVPFRNVLRSANLLREVLVCGSSLTNLPLHQLFFIQNVK